MMRLLLALIFVLATLPVQAQFIGGAGRWSGKPQTPTAWCSYPDVMGICAAADKTALVTIPDFYYGASGAGTPGSASQSHNLVGYSQNTYIVGSITAHISGTTLTIDSGTMPNRAVGVLATAGAAWAAGAISITLSATCPALPSGMSNPPVIDLTSQAVIGYAASCSGTTLALLATNDNAMAAGSNGDSLQIGPGLVLCDGSGRCAGGSTSRIVEGTYLLSGSGSTWTVSKANATPSEQMWLVARPNYNTAGVDFPIGANKTTANLWDPKVEADAGLLPAGATYHDGSVTYPWVAGTLWYQTSTTVADGPGGIIGANDGVYSGNHPTWNPGSPYILIDSTAQAVTLDGPNLGPVGNHGCTEVITTSGKYPVVVKNGRADLGVDCLNNMNGARVKASSALAILETPSGTTLAPVTYMNMEFYYHTVGRGAVGEFEGSAHPTSSTTCAGQVNCGNLTAVPAQWSNAPYAMHVSTNCTTLASGSVCTSTCTVPNCSGQHAATLAYNYVRDNGSQDYNTAGPFGNITSTISTNAFIDMYGNFFYNWSTLGINHGESGKGLNANRRIQDNVFFQSAGRLGLDTASITDGLSGGAEYQGYTIIDSNTLAVNASGGSALTVLNPSINFTICAVSGSSCSPNEPGSVRINSVPSGYTMGGFETLNGIGLLHGAYASGAGYYLNNDDPTVGGSGDAWCPGNTSFICAPLTADYTASAVLLNTNANYIYSGNQNVTRYGLFQFTGNALDVSGVVNSFLITGGSYNNTSGVLNINYLNYMPALGTSTQAGAIVSILGVKGGGNADILNGDWPLVTGGGNNNVKMQLPKSLDPGGAITVTSGYVTFQVYSTTAGQCNAGAVSGGNLSMLSFSGVSSFYHGSTSLTTNVCGGF